MLDLSLPLDEYVMVTDRRFRLDLSFDNVLRLLDMVSDQSIHDVAKPFLGLKMLTGANLSQLITLEESAELLKLIFDKYINVSGKDEKSYDLLGNELPNKVVKKGDRQYSLKHDGEYIYASFMQAYGIDLFKEQGKLRWEKFNALLNGLPEDTKFMQVVKIRTWKPSKGESSSYKSKMRELQNAYRLPDEAEY